MDILLRLSCCNKRDLKIQRLSFSLVVYRLEGWFCQHSHVVSVYGPSWTSDCYHLPVSGRREGTGHSCLSFLGSTMVAASPVRPSST